MSHAGAQVTVLEAAEELGEVCTSSGNTGYLLLILF